MTEQQLPDLSDPLVRDVVDRNHVPVEQWAPGAQMPRFVGMRCEQCYRPWRCETRRALDAWLQKNEPDVRQVARGMDWGPA